MFSMQEGSKYLSIYTGTGAEIYVEEDKKVNWEEEIKKLGVRLSEYQGQDFAVQEVRKRIGFACYCCRDGWRPTNPRAFFHGCFKNQEYNKSDWAKWIQETMDYDKEIRKERIRLSEMESVNPDLIPSYPPGRGAFNLVYSQVKSKVLPKVEDTLHAYVDYYRLNVIGHTISNKEDLLQESVTEQGTSYKTNNPTHSYPTTCTEGAPITHSSPSYEQVGGVIRSLREEGGVDSMYDVQAIMDNLRDEWKEKICHFVSIYGPANILKLHEEHKDEWLRLDFSSLYFLERFIFSYRNSDTLSRGKYREVSRLDPSLVVGRDLVVD